MDKGIALDVKETEREPAGTGTLLSPLKSKSQSYDIFSSIHARGVTAEYQIN
jgi:hypothetical protein